MIYISDTNPSVCHNFGIFRQNSEAGSSLSDVYRHLGLEEENENLLNSAVEEGSNSSDLAGKKWAFFRLGLLRLEQVNI